MPASTNVELFLDLLGFGSDASSASISNVFLIGGENQGKRNQSITFGALPDKTYGAAPFNLSATATSGLPVAFSIVSGPATLAGNVLIVTAAGTVKVEASQTGNDSYNPAAPVDETFTVKPALLTISAGTNTKVYDATTSAAAKPVVSGLVGSDTVTGLGETYATTAAGSSKTLTVSPGYTISDGNGGHNYMVTTVANTTGVISKAPLTIEATTNTKVYDSSTSAAAAPTVSGLVGNDTVTGLSESYADARAGAGRILTVNSGFTVSDNNGGLSYTVITVVELSGAITRAPLTITAQANTKTYDSSTSAAAVPSVAGLIGSDTVTGLAEAYGDRHAGTRKTLSVASYTVNDGAGGGDYQVITVSSSAGAITPAPLTFTATTNTKAYDGTTSAKAAPLVAGLLGLDMIAGLSESYSDPNVGSSKTLSVSSYTVLDGNGGQDYAVTTLNNTTGVIFLTSTSVFIDNTTEGMLEPPKGGTANYVFTVSLAKPLAQAVMVNYSTVNGTGASGAKAGTDFTGITNATLTIPAGATTAQIVVTILGDAPELPGGLPDEFFSVRLNWAVSATNVPQTIPDPSVTGDIEQTFAPTISMPAT